MAIDLRELLEADKRLATHPKWVQKDSMWLNLESPLDIDGITVEGLELRAGACQTLPDRAVRFHLQYHPAKGPCTPLCRIEWRPLSPHTNADQGPDHLRLQQITGSHIHGFEMNYLEAEGRMRGKNLPMAEPLTSDPKSYNDLLDVAANVFRISNMEIIEPPPWLEGGLFGF